MGKYTFQADDAAAVVGEAKVFSVKFEDNVVLKPLPVASVSVVLVPTSLAIGEKAVASASTFDKDGHPLQGRGISWHSDNTSAANVSPSGEVTAVGAGSVGIVATSEGRQGNFGLTIAAADKWSGSNRRGAERRTSTAPYNATPDRRSGNERRKAPAAPFGVPVAPSKQSAWDVAESRVDASYPPDKSPKANPFAK